MTTTNTFDVEETIAQIQKLEEAGCEIIRVTVPKKEDVEACRLIRSRIKIRRASASLAGALAEARRRQVRPDGQA